MACAVPMNLNWISDSFLAQIGDNSINFSYAQNEFFRRLRSAPKRHGAEVNGWTYCAEHCRWEK